MLSLVKQRASEHASSKAQPTVIILNKAKKAPSPKALTSPFAFCFRLRSNISSAPPACVPLQTLFSATFTNQSFSQLPVSWPPASWLHCLPGSTQMSWYWQRSLVPSIFSKDDITAIPVSRLLLWDAFCILAVPSWNIISEITFTELQPLLSLNAEKKKILKMFPEKRANVLVAEKAVRMKLCTKGT